MQLVCWLVGWLVDLFSVCASDICRKGFKISDNPRQYFLILGFKMAVISAKGYFSR